MNPVPPVTRIFIKKLPEQVVLKGFLIEVVNDQQRLRPRLILEPCVGDREILVDAVAVRPLRMELEPGNDKVRRIVLLDDLIELSLVVLIIAVDIPLCVI